MKKILIGLFALSAVSMASTFENSYFNIRVGGDFDSKYTSLYTNDDVDPFSMTSETDGFGYEIGLEYLLQSTDRLDIGFGFAFQDHSERDKNSFKYGNRVFYSEGLDYKSIPIYMTAKYDILKSKNKFNPYLKLDLGYSFNISENDIETGRISSSGSVYKNSLSVEVDNGLYAGIGIGFEYNYFTVDLMYKVNKAEADIKVNNNNDFDRNYGPNYDLKVDSDYERWVLTVGYKFNIR